jgi:AraC-like DNA-binding protein
MFYRFDARCSCRKVWTGTMNWSLSEFLNLVEVRGRNWSFIDMGARTGFRLPHGEGIYFHVLLQGLVRLTTAADQVLECKAGDIAIVLSGEAHKIRNLHGRTATVMESLLHADSGDAPSQVKLGKGAVENRLLSGRAEAIWPAGLRTNRLPAVLSIKAAEAGIKLDHFVEHANQPGGCALLSSLARLLLVDAFRANRHCRAQVQLNLEDPIARAKVLIERYPFQPWKVETLAARVGMGRSNFATRFVTQFGKTPIEALTEERMKHAAGLLSHTNLKTAEVSERVGYRSEASFISRFRTHFGQTPGKWRRLRSSSP